MLKQYKRTTNIGVGIGFVLLTLGRYLSMSGTSELLTLPVGLSGLVLFLWGCGQYARAKGYSQWWGALGILYILGLIILFFFPDRHKAVSTGSDA
jgi:hypothetical protein